MRRAGRVAPGLAPTVLIHKGTIEETLVSRGATLCSVPGTDTHGPVSRDPAVKGGTLTRAEQSPQQRTRVTRKRDRNARPAPLNVGLEGDGAAQGGRGPPSTQAAGGPGVGTAQSSSAPAEGSGGPH